MDSDSDRYPQQRTMSTAMLGLVITAIGFEKAKEDMKSQVEHVSGIYLADYHLDHTPNGQECGHQGARVSQ